ncbi:MAG: ADP-ribosylglycohydrolase family protein [Sphaerochaetaceae bacterium]|nr:ADP-ribosylglycohydrolase family protein [Sphaerochaetaceae bacterium]MDC7238102.1 ADP-ribosylglycohydrolase family protein [Sphaerochaetaceae bacterium]MDC7249951.1 ADP-ribosylglycohydrolase family protein [Sphaerochaetaceae bacterium]
MIGAIIGDIVGSRFELNNHKSKSFDLFTNDCHITDDSILTIAVAKAIMESEKILKYSLASHFKNEDYCKILKNNTIKYLKEFGNKYPNSGYGGMFRSWLHKSKTTAYYSFGNGAAMRIGPIGYFARTIDDVYMLSDCVTGVTHNHEEGLKGAQAIAVAIFLCRCGLHKSEVKNKIEKKYYDLNFTIDEIRDSYTFSPTCQHTVPQAIVAFFESTSFEDAIRIAISLGGDSDTIAAMTGSIAQSYYGVPKEMEEKALTYLDKELRDIYKQWVLFIENKNCLY